jgi:hypothetical protein
MDEGIQFDNQAITAPATAERPLSALTGLVIRMGLAKDARSASYVLLATAAVAVVLAFVVPMILGSSPKRIPQSELEAQMPPSSVPGTM